MSWTKKTGMPRRTEARQTGARGVPPGRDLDRVLRGQRVDELARSPRSCAPARAGRTSRRSPPSVYSATSWPRSLQAVEVLEDVAVAAADAGVLGHVDDAQARRRRVRTSRRSKKSPQRAQKRRWEATLALAGVRARGVTDSRWVRLARG